MTDYSGLSNITEEARQRLTDLADWTGEGALIIENEGVPVSPLTPTLNFTGTGVNVASSAGKTVVTVGAIASGNDPAPVQYQPTINQTGITGGPIPLDLMVFSFDNGSTNDWTVTDVNTLTADRTGIYHVSATFTLDRTAGTLLQTMLGSIRVNGVDVLLTPATYQDSSNEMSFHLIGAFQVALGQTLEVILTNVIGTFTMVAARSWVSIIRVD